jgi:arsenate reductase
MSPAVIFACVHNAGRSQMAAAWFDQLADPARATALSAGTQPGTRVHPEVVLAMREVGIELSGNVPQFLSDALAARASHLITMGCGDACPVVPGAVRDDWPLPDPKGRPIEEVRRIRDEIRDRVQTLIDANGWGRPG